MATDSSILAWENPMNRGAWWATIHGVTKSQIRPSTYVCTSNLSDLGRGGVGVAMTLRPKHTMAQSGSGALPGRGRKPALFFSPDRKSVV